MTTAVKRPDRLMPLLYFGTAHVALALACALAALWPRAVAGFFYHSWMVALVHLVTIGWITFSIFGAIYIVGPLALRIDMPARRSDVVVYGAALIGVVGMVAHFWIEKYSGMAWSAGMVLTAVFYMTARIANRVRAAAVPAPVKLHVMFAAMNFCIAGTMGVLIAVNKSVPFLPGYALANVFAHAHLATIGWAVMMAVGVAYRLLPMILPSKMPTGPSGLVGAIVLETGVVGLFTTLLLQSRWSLVFGAMICAGLVVFARQVVWMLRHRVPKPAAAPRIDFAVWHAAGAGLSLMVAAIIGLVLLVAPMSTRTLQAAAAYGVLGLVGFLGQLIVAMETRLLPMAAWFWTGADSGDLEPPPSPLVMRDRMLQSVVFAGWSAGVPSLAAGLFFESAPMVAIGASALFVGVTLGALDSTLVVISTFHTRKRAPAPR